MFSGFLLLIAIFVGSLVLAAAFAFALVFLTSFVRIISYAFRTSPAWALCSICVPFAIFVFVCSQMESTKEARTFLRASYALILLIPASIFSGYLLFQSLAVM